MLLSKISMTTEPLPDLAPLSPEQIERLTENQKEIFVNLDEKDREFFSAHFSPETLGKALERKWETIQSQSRVQEFDKHLKEKLTTNASRTSSQAAISGSDLAVSAAGVAGAVGIGVLASQIAPAGKASWRGVSPHDLLEPLYRAFAQGEKTDLKFQPPTEAGVLHGAIYVRTQQGLIPGLAISLTPIGDSTEVYISKVSSESIIDAIKNGSQKLFDLIRDGLILSARKGGLENLIALAASIVSNGVDIARIVKDLDLEDKAWETIKLAADPLQRIYDERKAIENANRLKLEQAWDDYYNCPKCGVSFGADDKECRVCGTARPEKLAIPDPRLPQA